MNHTPRRTTPCDEPVRLTLRLPADTVRRLREVARQRGLSVNGLLDEAASLALLEYEFMCRSGDTAPPTAHD